MPVCPESFQSFCDLCEQLQQIKTHADKDAILSNYIKAFKEMDQEMLLKSTYDKKPSFYRAMRLLVPELERERGPYGLKETALSKLLINSLCLHGLDANKLLNYKLRTNTKKGIDFADVVYWTLKGKCSELNSLTVTEVNEILDTLALHHAEHKANRETEMCIYKLSKVATAQEMKWIIRIILKDMKLGMGNNRILKIFHQDASDLYDVSSNLLKVCEDLNDSERRLHEIEITLYTPFRPMLSLRCDSIVFNNEVADNRLYYIENKFDGERFQLHMQNGIYRYFSKNGYDYTSTYGDTYNSTGLITPHLKNMFKNIKSFILDGEMMGWNLKTKKFGSKGMNFDVKNLKTDSVHRPCFCVFDILQYNDKILTNSPLKNRINILNDVISEVEGVIMKSKIVEAKSKEDILGELNKSADNKDEGICIKDPDSIYKPNNRKAGWWKMKLEYFDDLLNELDLLIIGGYYGDGRRRGLISSFLLAVADTPNNSSNLPTHFLSFAKVASGFTTEELDKLVDKLKPHWQIVNKDKNPSEIIWKKQKPDVWIEPRKSYILQVKATELVRSAGFQTDYTLRFPRVEKIRYDKQWYNCMTTTELKALTSSRKAVEKLNKRYITVNDLENKSKKRKKQNACQIYVPILEGQFINDLFKDKEICVFTGNHEYSKDILEMKVVQHGGKLVKVDGPNTFCIVVGDITTAVPILKKNSPRDIVKVDWFIRAIKHSSEIILDWTPNDLLNMSPKTKYKLSYIYDKYGDSYTDKISRENIQIILNNVQEQEDYLNLIPQEMNEFDKNMFYNNPLSLFRMCFAYFDKNENDDSYHSKIRRTESDFRFFGGIKCEKIAYHTTHIILHLSDLSRIENLKQKICEENYKHIIIVNENWIANCILSKKMLCEKLFSV